MKKQLILGTLVATTVMQAASPAYADKESVGNIIGGIVGGVIGSQIGKGNGNTAAIILGTIAGTMIGGKVGRDMDEADRRALAEAQDRALRDQLGRRTDWDGRSYGSRTGARGSFTSIREGYNSRTGEYCREYTSVISVNNRTEETRGVACSRRDGSWYEVRETEVRFGGGNSVPESRPPRYPENPQLPPPPPPVQSLQEGTLQINGISRRGGGEWYRINLQTPVTLERVEVAALAAQLKIHEASVITTSRQRIQIREFQNTSVFGAGSRAVSENLNLREAIVALDIRAESYGAFADIRVSAFSNQSRPLLLLDNAGNGGECSRRGDVSYELNRLDADMEQWSRRKNNSNYNSPEYNMAERELKAVAARMVEIGKSREAQDTSLAKLEELGTQYFRKMNNFTYNSTQYNAYSEIGKAMFGAMDRALDDSFVCDVQASEQLTLLGESYISKMNNHSYNSVPYNSFRGLAAKIFTKAPQFFEQEVLLRGKSFREIDVDMESFASKQGKHSYNSIPYNGFGDLVTKAALLSENNLRQIVFRMGANERFELARYFEQRRNSFSYGSVVYKHYTTMKDIVTNVR
ncbi:beta-sandwich domain-containing protein [Bdellovibrio sp.]|uniref:beta-sandwich domain-containing protein n=1 Tax=Bdellovibrio sp. TaxID=28201 RepID=UPI0039E63EC1